jgi:uncharacterized membrane protein
MKKLKDHYPTWIEWMLVLVICWSFYYAIRLYPELPDKIPVHFGPGGQPDAWRARTWGSVLGLSLVGAGMYLFITVISLFMVNSKTPMRFINLPISRHRLENVTEEQTETLRRIAIQLMVVVKGLLVLTFSWLSCSSLQVAMGIRQGLGNSFWIFICLLLGAVGWLTARMYRVIGKPVPRQDRKSKCQNPNVK